MEIKVIINIQATHPLPFMGICLREQEEKLASTVFHQQRHFVTLFTDLFIDLFCGWSLIRRKVLFKPWIYKISMWGLLDTAPQTLVRHQELLLVFCTEVIIKHLPFQNCCCSLNKAECDLFIHSEQLTYGIWVQVVKHDIHKISSESFSHYSLENFLTKNCQVLITAVLCGMHVVSQENSLRKPIGRNTFTTQAELV